MTRFHEKLGKFKPLPLLPKGKTVPAIRVYMAKSHKDRPLENEQVLKEYIMPIQVGAACADYKVADITDNTGDNISDKNGNYSELTGLYWMWKNELLTDDRGGDGTQYYGLAQYRRMLDFSNNDLLRLADDDVDVVLPYPLMYEPDINAHHERYLTESDWNTLLAAVRELQPDYSEKFVGILGQQYLYNYNVILAKKAVLREYCEWLFPILERVEELSVPKGSERADRYIGYMAEVLETLYFMKNAKRLNIVHTGCRMYV